MSSTNRRCLTTPRRIRLPLPRPEPLSRLPLLRSTPPRALPLLDREAQGPPPRGAHACRARRARRARRAQEALTEGVDRQVLHGPEACGWTGGHRTELPCPPLRRGEEAKVGLRRCSQEVDQDRRCQAREGGFDKGGQGR